MELAIQNEKLLPENWATCSHPHTEKLNLCAASRAVLSRATAEYYWYDWMSKNKMNYHTEKEHHWNVHNKFCTYHDLLLSIMDIEYLCKNTITLEQLNDCSREHLNYFKLLEKEHGICPAHIAIENKEPMVSRRK